MREGIRILHVEDDPDFAEQVSRFVERLDEAFTVETVHSTAAGLERLEAGTFDCVVSDYDMPGRNGIEFLEAVRDIDPDLPFVLFTGKGSEEVASDAISAGVTDYLQKQTGTSQYRVLANRVRNAVEQYRARRAAAEAEKTLDQLAEKTDDILFVFDGEWSELLFVNSAYEEIWGRPVADLEADPLSFLEAIHPDDRERAEGAVAELQAGDPVEIEYRVCRPDGEIRWIRGTTRPVREDGEVSRILGSVRDVTEQKRQERELRRAERRYRAVFDDPNILVALLEPDGTTIDVNQTALGFVDEAVEAIRGEPFWETPWFEHTPSVGTDVESWVQRAADGEYVEFEAVLERADGGAYAVDSVIRPVRDDDGEVVSLLATAREVTERRERRRRLREERQFIESVVDAIPDVFYAFDGSGYLTRWNEELEVVSGYTADEIEEMYVTEFVPDDEVETIQTAFERIVEAGERVTVESAFETKAGERVPYEFTGGPLYDGGDEVTGVTGVGRDISARLERERELRAERDRLEEFAGVVSHDLRSPLSVASGRLALAREDCDSVHHDPIGEALERMEGIIEDVLWLAREGRDIGETEPIDLGALADDAWSFGGTETDGDATLEVALDDGQAGAFEADPVRLQQLLENLFRNALEHGGTDVTVRLERLPDGFAVADDGPGIPDDVRERVFEAGYSTTGDGIGLGLAIVAGIADAHGWDVAVTESHDGGARFEFTGVGPGDGGSRPEE